MATTEEKTELVETLKGPRFYRIQLWGYGGESAYIPLNKAQYDFWKAHTEEHYDGDLVTYMTGSEDGDYDFENLTEVPKEADFMMDEDGEYNSSVKRDIVDGKDLAEYINELDEANNYELELTDMGVSDYEEWDAEYICQFYSAEKGTFFEGVIETVGDFDPKKLKIYTLEYANGDDTISNIEYDGVDIDNYGGDTNGKGYSAHLWQN